MKRIKEQKLTFWIAELFIFTAIVDIILRFINGVNLVDIVLGNNAGTGIYSYIWFKSELFWSGQIWRMFTWPLFSRGLMSYIAEIIIFVLICYQIEKWIGKTKLIVIILGLELTILFGSYFSYCDSYNDFTINYGIAGIMPLLFGLFGFYFTLIFIEGYKRENDNKLFSAINIIVVFYMFFQVMLSVINKSGQFIMFYGFSFGMCYALVLNIKYLSVIRKKDNKIFEDIPNRAYPFTVVTILLCVIIFILNIFTSYKLLPENLNGQSSFRYWIQFLLYDGDYGTVSKYLLFDTEAVKGGQIWRFLTHIYSHTGLVHILTNMPAIFFAGRMIERIYGTKKIMIIYFCSAVVVVMFPLIEGITTTTMGGSSLSIYALFAVYLLLVCRKDNNIPYDGIGFVYICLYFILGNIPSIGEFGESHLTSYMVGYIAVFIFMIPTSMKGIENS